MHEKKRRRSGSKNNVGHRPGLRLPSVRAGAHKRSSRVVIESRYPREPVDAHEHALQGGIA